jgi:hypothetical protein
MDIFVIVIWCLILLLLIIMKIGIPKIIKIINEPKIFKVFIKLILILLVILFAVYVWPTPYRNMPPFGGGHTPFRIHRITGIGELWYHSKGWTKY